MAVQNFSSLETVNGLQLLYSLMHLARICYHTSFSEVRILKKDGSIIWKIIENLIIIIIILHLFEDLMWAPMAR